MIQRPKTIAYYITPHGFGHAVRSLEIARSLLELDPGLHIIIVSDIPEFLIAQNVGKPLPYRRRRLDVGLVQQDSIRFDLGATLRALKTLHDQQEELIGEEVRFLRSQGVDAVVADIPFLTFHAAHRCGLPTIGISNFTWEWIYSAYAGADPAWDPLVEWTREGYQKCGLFLQLPMHGDCSACPEILDVPLVARRAGLNRKEARGALGCSPEQKAYLIAFSHLDLSPEAQKRIERLDHAVFYYKHPLSYDFANGRSLDGLDLGYVDVVSAVDGVITKPGYGIVSDCLAHGVPMIYSDRGFFPEYEILVREMKRHLTTVHMPSSALYSGDWDTYIRRMETLPRLTPHIVENGASVCARLILEQLSQGKA